MGGLKPPHVVPQDVQYRNVGVELVQFEDLEERDAPEDILETCEEWCDVFGCGEDQVKPDGVSYDECDEGMAERFPIAREVTGKESEDEATKRVTSVVLRYVWSGEVLVVADEGLRVGGREGELSIGLVQCDAVEQEGNH